MASRNALGASHAACSVGVAVDGGRRSVLTLRWAGFEALQRAADLVAVYASDRGGRARLRRRTH